MIVCKYSNDLIRGNRYKSFGGSTLNLQNYLHEFKPKLKLGIHIMLTYTLGVITNCVAIYYYVVFLLEGIGKKPFRNICLFVDRKRRLYSRQIHLLRFCKKVMFE